jgi:peroxisomal 2,4-dienoyl-CoA reductase
MGDKDDIANGTIYLFSPAAAYVTGTQLVVDGGDTLVKLQNTMMDYPKVLLEGKDFRPKSKM